MAPPSPKAEAATTADRPRLSELAMHRYATVRLEVANNTATPDDALLLLIADADPTVRANAAAAATHRPWLHEDLSRADDKWVRAMLAHTFAQIPTHGLVRDIQSRLAKDPFHEVRGRVGETTSHLDLFERLLGDADPKVRGMCAANPRLTRDQMEQLLMDRIARVRATAVTVGIVYPDDDQLVRMASDRSVEVRWAVLARPSSPRSALVRLSEDPDEMNRDHAQQALEGGLNPENVVGSVRRVREQAEGLAFGDIVRTDAVPDDDLRPTGELGPPDFYEELLSQTWRRT